MEGKGNYTHRSIPAWAGETSLPRIPAHITAVYPRVGGGNRIPIADKAAAEGLSPRGRGKPSATAGVTAMARSIPAWAGETVVVADEGGG